ERAVDGHVLPRTLPRPGDCRRDLPVRLADCRSRRCSAPGLTLSGDSRVRHQPDPSSYSAGAQPARPAADRTPRQLRNRIKRPAPAWTLPVADDAGRVSGPGTVGFL